jgi:TetR/AcrR family transcriptional regulator, mexJK operon transcriptional repressor
MAAPRTGRRAGVAIRGIGALYSYTNESIIWFAGPLSPVSPGRKSHLAAAVHRSGRPKDIAKREAVISAARRLFATQPFDLVTMETIAKLAGVSKMTVYSHFRDKETLFETIVLATSDQMISSLSAPNQPGGLRERLLAVGTIVLNVILGSDICTMAHTLPAALRANRDLADRFYAAGPGRVRAALAAIIAEAAKRGQLSVDDPDWAADDLVSLWEGSMPAKIAFGIVGLSTPEEIRLRAERGTDVFLRAYQPTGRPERTARRKAARVVGATGIEPVTPRV